MLYFQALSEPLCCSEYRALPFCCWFCDFESSSSKQQIPDINSRSTILGFQSIHRTEYDANPKTVRTFTGIIGVMKLCVGMQERGKVKFNDRHGAFLDECNVFIAHPHELLNEPKSYQLMFSTSGLTIGIVAKMLTDLFLYTFSDI